MTQDTDNGKNNPTYEVGRGRPPKEHRFVKGRSGNPSGRPRQKDQNRDSEFCEEQMKGLMVEEYYRPITIREGDKVIRISAAQAAFRSQAIAAVKGSLRAQREVVSNLRWIESGRRKVKLEGLEFAIKYKAEMSEKLQDPERWGIKESDVVPHPDDIEINDFTGDVSINGPVTIQQRDAQDQMVAMIPGIQEDIRKLERRLSKKPGDPVLEALLRQRRKHLDNAYFVNVIVMKRAPRSRAK